MIPALTIEQKLFDYIDEMNKCLLITGNGITLEIVDSTTLQAEHKYIDTEDTTLSVVLYGDKKVFVDALKIKKLADIYTLTPDQLMEVYHKGLAEIVCFVDCKYACCLSFQKCGEDILATNDSNVTHLVAASEKLETNDQFISYTMGYYVWMETPDN